MGVLDESIIFTPQVGRGLAGYLCILTKSNLLMRTKIISTSIILSKNQRSQLLKPFELIAQQHNFPALILILQHPISSGIWNYTFVTSLSKPTILEFGATIFKLDGTEKECIVYNGRNFTPRPKKRTLSKNPQRQEPSPNRILKVVRPRELYPAEIRAKMDRT